MKAAKSTKSSRTIIPRRARLIIGTKMLLKLVAEKNLVEGLSDRELASSEGSGFDLRIGEIFSIEGTLFLGIESRNTPPTTSLASYGAEKSYYRQVNFQIRPGEYFLGRTIEKVNIPPDITAHLTPRTTTFRGGLLILLGNVAPGYSGQLTFGMANLQKEAVWVELGARVIHIQFSLIFGEGGYRGQWQGGRVSTEGKTERQV